MCGNPLTALGYKVCEAVAARTDDYHIDIFQALEQPLGVIIEINTPGFEFTDGERELFEAEINFHVPVGYHVAFKFDAS